MFSAYVDWAFNVDTLDNKTLTPSKYFIFNDKSMQLKRKMVNFLVWSYVWNKINFNISSFWVLIFSDLGVDIIKLKPGLYLSRKRWKKAFFPISKQKS